LIFCLSLILLGSISHMDNLTWFYTIYEYSLEIIFPSFTPLSSTAAGQFQTILNALDPVIYLFIFFLHLSQSCDALLQRALDSI